MTLSQHFSISFLSILKQRQLTASPNSFTLRKALSLSTSATVEPASFYLDMLKRQGDSASSARMLRNAKKPGTDTSWTSLPVEIRLTILEEISPHKHRGWHPLAAVCKEWQIFVERKNFRRLKLQASYLEELEYIVIRQRDLVQYIWLNIELSRYTCQCCQRAKSMSWLSRHSSIIGGIMLKLFSVLNTWQPTSCLVLELNAYSPSDSEHWFKNYHFRLEHDDGGDLVQQQEVTTR